MSEQWSEWIEHKPGDPCPIPWAKQSEWAWSLDSRDRPDTRRASLDAASDKSWSSNDRYQITAYRYRLDCATAGFVPPGAEKPWVPEQVPGFGPWIEANSYPDGISGKAVLVLLTAERRERRLFSLTPYVYQRDDWAGFVAYCLKLEDQPTQEQVEATQKPETPQADATEW